MTNFLRNRVSFNLFIFVCKKNYYTESTPPVNMIYVSQNKISFALIEIFVIIRLSEFLITLKSIYLHSPIQFREILFLRESEVLLRERNR